MAETQEDFLAKEFADFMNATFNDVPPPSGSAQYVQLRFAFYGGALAAQGKDLVPELLMFYTQLETGTGLVVKDA